jgi:hypothetical protein
MSRYELSISTDYVPDWKLTDAVRELFQNALDQQTVEPDNEMFLDYKFYPEISMGVLEIGNEKSILQVKSLLLGSSSKRNDDGTIGQFGEGYKIAALVLTRLGKQLTIFNHGAKEVWTFKFVESRRFNSRLLVVDIDKKPFWIGVSDNSLVIRVEGITEHEYEDIKDSNLSLQIVDKIESTTYGRILLDEKYKGKMFVKGLYVCTNKEFHYGYDFKPKYMKIDRDRKAVADWDLTYITSRMWIETNSDKIVELAKANAKDIQHYKYHVPTQVSSHATEAAEAFKKEHGPKAMPVTNQDEASDIKKRGLKPVIVSEPLQVIIAAGRHLSPEKKSKQVYKPVTTYDRFNKWYKRYRNVLDEDAKVHFRELLAELKKKEEKK